MKNSHAGQCFSFSVYALTLAASSLAMAAPLVTLPLKMPVSGPIAGISAALTQSLADLKSGDRQGYAAIYAAPPARAEALRSVQAFLGNHTLHEARFVVTKFRSTTPKTAWLEGTETLDFFIPKPTTYLKTPQGTAVVNNTAHMTRRRTVQQNWVRRGSIWRIRRTQTVKTEAFGVL